ncbi:unnamed protein product, partial [Brassica oleracea]
IWHFLVCASVSHSIVINTYMHLPLMLESYSLQSLFLYLLARDCIDTIKEHGTVFVP